jgi:hypothetical protein
MRPSVILLILITFFVLLSCKKSELAPNSDLIIKAGFMCGWGSGEDSLEISQSRIKYVYYIPSQSRVPIINKSRSVTESEWTQILNIINLDDFVKLNYQSCNICVDGCDEWISIQDDKISHNIRIGKGSRIDTISKLQNKLAELRAEFSK